MIRERRAAKLQLAIDRSESGTTETQSVNKSETRCRAGRSKQRRCNGRTREEKSRASVAVSVPGAGRDAQQKQSEHASVTVHDHERTHTGTRRLRPVPSRPRACTIAPSVAVAVGGTWSSLPHAHHCAIDPARRLARPRQGECLFVCFPVPSLSLSRDARARHA